MLKGIMYVFAALVVFGALFGDDTGSPSASRSSEPKCGDEIGAWVAAKYFIEKRLKNPRSAKFPWSTNSEGVRVTAQTDCKWLVGAWVDATNSFGGTVRTTWFATVQRRDGDWYLVDEPGFL